MPLITKIISAIEKNEIAQPFTVSDLKKWMRDNDVRQDDGSFYAENSINAILSNSDLKNNPTSNLNRKMLRSKLLNSDKNHYWIE